MTEATHWEIGAVKITCIVEVSWGFPPGILSTGLTAERVKKIEWLRPHFQAGLGRGAISPGPCQEGQQTSPRASRGICRHQPGRRGLGN